MQSQLVILGLSVLWGAWLSPSVRGELIGPNVCTRNEAFTTIVRVSETVPYQKREIVWCFSLPPKCSVYKMGYRQVYKNDTITQTRLVEECCKGYMLSPAGNRCVPVCTDECIRGTCIAPNTCKCEVGFGGPTCNIGTCLYPAGRLVRHLPGSNYSVSLRKNREADRHNPNLYNSIEDFKEHLYDEIPGKPTLPEDSYDHLDHRRPATSLKPHYHRTANGGVKGSQELLAAHIDTDFGGPSIPNGNSPPAVPAGNPARLAGPGAYENSTTPGGNSASSTQDFGRNSTSSADFGRMKAELESLGDRRGSTGNEL
ncbi:protein draper-like [Diaphorina citri]|uniref:Protein draper-like n=1 Tax=Diaphorina citri TaxID=121845 RepID=A0A3Q0J6F7_DIACI|nr:protein draper-like [Diaphorina citri]